MSGRDAATLWTSLDPDGPPRLVWARPASSPRVAMLLGAFDPPTNAHVDVLLAAAAPTDAAPVLCMTKVLLARPADELLSRERRIEVVCALAERLDAGVAFANRGTYLDVGRAIAADGIDASFVVGADKIEQLADPGFYADGADGVRATFDELRFVVVPRAGIEPIRMLPTGRAVRVLDPAEVFRDAATAALSGTEVRRLVRSGVDVSGLVPPEVASALRGYTSAR